MFPTLAPNLTAIHAANADTGSTGHYMAFRDASILKHLQIASNPITVTLPDGSCSTSTHTAVLDIPALPDAARRVDVFPDFVSSLLSIGVLCDSGMIATYDATSVTISLNNEVVLSGIRNPATNLWMVDLVNPQALPPLGTCAMARTSPPSGTIAQIVAFYHASMNSPAISTFIAALSKDFIRFPGLSVDMVRKYPPNSIATAKGHLDQTRQGVQSTKQHDDYDETIDDWHPVPVARLSRRASIYVHTISVHPPSQERHTDLTGRFPAVAKSGAQYHMVMICANYIHVETIKSRSGPDFLSGYKAATIFWKAHGIEPLYERIDNESSTGLKFFVGSRHPLLRFGTSLRACTVKAKRSEP